MTDVNDGDLGKIVTRMQVLHEDVTDIKSALKDLTTAITKLALIEERQAQASIALERAFKALEKVEDRVAKLEQALPASSQTNKWVERFILAVASAGLVYVAKHVGLI
jgi:DNA repair exonuclease SbcCD ATPase subunit